MVDKGNNGEIKVLTVGPCYLFRPNFTSLYSQFLVLSLDLLKPLLTLEQTVMYS